MFLNIIHRIYLCVTFWNISYLIYMCTYTRTRYMSIVSVNTVPHSPFFPYIRYVTLA